MGTVEPKRKLRGHVLGAGARPLRLLWGGCEDCFLGTGMSWKPEPRVGSWGPGFPP